MSVFVKQSGVPAEVKVVEAAEEKKMKEVLQPAPVAVASVQCLEESIAEILAITKSARLEDAGSGGDRDSLTESLALSDDRSLCSSFTSLDTLIDQLEPDQMSTNGATLGGGAVSDQSIKSPTPNQSGSVQNLETSRDVVPESQIGNFRRQKWETRSMTNFERGSMDAEKKINISVGGWAETKHHKTEGAAVAAGEGPVTAGATVQTKGSFVRKRDLWEKRASIPSVPSAPLVTGTPPPTQNLQVRQKHTPDLVMDLPPSAALSSSPKEMETVVDPSRQRHESGGSGSSGSGSNASSPGSPDMTTAAETFAMQNQNTLKKSTIKQAKKETEAIAMAQQTESNPPTVSSLLTSATANEPQRPPSSVKVTVSAYGSTPTVSSPASVRSITPKPVQRFTPHANLYGTPMPVLPVAFEATAASSVGDSSRPLVKVKPAVLKKPTLPVSLNSPDSPRQSTFEHDPQI